MVPLHKLARLPRHQLLRKAEKLFHEAERAIAGVPGTAADGKPQSGAPDRSYLAELAALLLAQGAFPDAAAAALSEAAASLRDGPGEGLRRAVNTVRHTLLAETGRQPADWDFVDADGVLDGGARRVFTGLALYLEDVRSPFNVGSIFRTAESFGARILYLSPLCADPNHPRSERTAMGCTAVLPWERRSLSQLEGPLFALETGGVPLDAFHFPESGTMIVGSEELGVSPAALALADASAGRVSIPTYGAKGSLNVAVATGIALRAWAARLAAGS